MLASMSGIDPRADLPLVDWSELGVSGPPHPQRHVKCGPHEHAMIPTRNRPGRNGWPVGQRSGGRPDHPLARG